MKCLEVQKLQEKFPAIKTADIECIKEWLKKQPHLPPVSDLLIAIFLHTTACSIEAAKIRIDNFYTCRTKIKNVFASRDPAAADMKAHKDTVAYMTLPELTPEGNAVLFTKVLDPENFNVRAYLRKCNFTPEINLLEKGPVEGFIFLIDMDGARISHVAQANINEIRQILFYLEHGFPGRIIGAHFFNPVPFMAQVLALIKPFLSAELKEQVKVHETLEDLHKCIPAKILPRDYKGGEALSVKELSDQYYQELLDNREYFLEEGKLRVNEDLRPEKSKALDEIFGLEGHFKKLDID